MSKYEPNNTHYFSEFAVDYDNIIYGPFDYSRINNRSQLRQHRKNILYFLQKSSKNKNLKLNLLEVSMKLNIPLQQILSELGVEMTTYEETKNKLQEII